jgi:hypothetical protein
MIRRRATLEQLVPHISQSAVENLWVESHDGPRLR